MSHIFHKILSKGKLSDDSTKRDSFASMAQMLKTVHCQLDGQSFKHTQYLTLNVLLAIAVWENENTNNIILLGRNQFIKFTLLRTSPRQICHECFRLLKESPAKVSAKADLMLNWKHNKVCWQGSLYYLIDGAHREKIGLKSKISQSRTKVSQKLSMWELGTKKLKGKE